MLVAKPVAGVPLLQLRLSFGVWPRQLAGLYWQWLVQKTAPRNRMGRGGGALGVTGGAGGVVEARRDAAQAAMGLASDSAIQICHVPCRLILQLRQPRQLRRYHTNVTPQKHLGAGETGAKNFELKGAA